MARTLYDEEKSAIEAYVRRLCDTQEDRRARRLLLFVAVIGLIASGLAAALGWAVVKAAESVAKETVQSDDVRKIMNSHVDQALSDSISASSSAKSARASADSAEHTAKEMDSRLASYKDLGSLLSNINNLAKNDDFQKAVVRELPNPKWRLVVAAGDFDLGCEYRLHLKSWLFEAQNRTSGGEIDVLATKVSTKNITAIFLGGPSDATIIMLAVKSSTKTIADEIGGPGNGSMRSVAVFERCSPSSGS